jgi:hypothetical protein
MEWNTTRSHDCSELFWLPQLQSTHVKTHKLLQVCKQVVTNLFTSCQQVVFAHLFTVVVTDLEQVVNNL